MTTKPRDSAWVLRMGRHGVQVLAAVLVAALVFTMVNVQQFAAQGHPTYGVQWWIAWLLDPMASLTMAAAIVFEGLLADYGKPKVRWLTATKWYAGVATWGMNVWASAAAGSLAGVWLHSVAPGLVLGLAEAAPRVRRHMAEIIAELEAKPEPVHAVTPLTDGLPAPGAAPWPQLHRPLVSPAGTARRVGEAAAATPQPRIAPPLSPPATPPLVAPAPRPVTVKASPTLTTRDTPEPSAGSGTPAPPGDGDDLVARVRALLAEADGRAPGRRAVAKALGVTEHQARGALDLVAAATGPALNGAGGKSKPATSGRGAQ